MNIIGKEHDWDKLSPYFLKEARIFNPIQSMLGTFKLDAPTQTTQKERRQRVRNELVSVMRSYEVIQIINFITQTQQIKPHTEIPQKATDETKRAQFLNVIMKHLNKVFYAISFCVICCVVINFYLQLLKDNDNTPIPYYQLICDPDSFQHTIDNLFQLSFLFRDGFISFDIGEDGLPTVSLATELQKKNKNTTGNHQFVSSMDPSMWEVSELLLIAILYSN